LRRVGVVVIFLVSLVVFDRVLTTLLARTPLSAERQSELSRKLEDVHGKSDYQILILGTSRTFEGIHPLHIVDGVGVRAYKEAFQGKGPQYNYEFYKRYKQIVGKPRVVIYGVDYFIFNITSEKWALERFGVRPDGPASSSNVRWPLLLLQNKSVNDRAIVTALQRLQERSNPRHAEYNPERYVRDMETYTGNTMPRNGDRGDPPPARYERIPFPRYPGTEGVYLVKLLQELEHDGVAVMLAALPDFVATYRTDFEQQRFDAEFREMARRYRNCVFVNYNDPTRFHLSDPAYFIDGKYGNPNSHLSKDGALALAPLLIADLRKALAAGAPR
jgi:hypothetical protein